MAETEKVLSIVTRVRGALQASKDIKKVDSAVGNLSKRSIALGTATGIGLERLAEFGIRKVGSAITGGIEDLAKLESATMSVDGAIKQVGLTGQLTGAQVAGWSQQIETAVGSAFDDKAITQATSTLIRFGKVTPDNLKPAMVVMTDLATKTGDVDSAASLLAKALADPTKAAGKLAKNGVILTKEQQKQIAVMVKAGKVAQAQKIILDSLAQTTKGAALASQGPYARSLATLKDVTEEAQKALAEGFLPVIEKVRDFLSKELAKPETLQRIRDFGKDLASGLDSLISLAKNLPWGAIGDAMKLAGQGAKAALDLFTGMPAWVQTAVLTGWGLNKLTGGMAGSLIADLGKGLIKGVLGMNAAVVNINAGVVNGAGGVGGAAEGAAGALGGISISTIASIATLAMVPVIPAILAMATTDPRIRALSEAGHAQTAAARSATGNPASIYSGNFPRAGGVTPGLTKTDYQQPIRVLTDHQDELRRDTMTRLASVRERLEANRIAVQSGSTQIVAAIRAQQQQFAFTFNLPGGRQTTRVTSGSTLSRRYSGKIVPLG